ncbi:hypothetical protein [Nocardia abscessus]|uniref:hypothetical protein n=1 Tax=Nocardia abscessus TaxID=120957 RepID=UPI0024548FDF|nr:hypothetical protein [Nocardia abscessus]
MARDRGSHTSAASPNAIRGKPMARAASSAAAPSMSRMATRPPSRLQADFASAAGHHDRALGKNSVLDDTPQLEFTEL